jgi:hypothetical protein
MSEFTGTSILLWRDYKYVEAEIASLSNEDLLSEYGAEEQGELRSISSDPPSPIDKLKEEIFRRMAAYVLPPLPINYRAEVKKVYPGAFSMEWQGSWKIYKEKLEYRSRLTHGSGSEEEAWESAYSCIVGAQ